MKATKFDWGKLLIKVTSRKFILALVGVIIGLYLILTEKGTTESIAGVISTMLSIVGYLVSETSVDVATAGNLDTGETESITDEILALIDDIKILKDDIKGNTVVTNNNITKTDKESNIVADTANTIANVSPGTAEVNSVGTTGDVEQATTDTPASKNTDNTHPVALNKSQVQGSEQ